MPRARIKMGAAISIDMQFWSWPDCPHGSLLKVFEVEGIIAGTLRRCRASNFGGEPYGNGCVAVYDKDLIWLDDQDFPWIGEGI